MNGRILTVAGLALLGVLLIACDDSSPEPSPTQTARETDSATPLPGRAGIAEVDAVLAAVESRDRDRVRDVIRFESLPCVGWTPANLGGPPLCATDEPPGTRLEVLRGVGCHGDYARVDTVLDVLTERRLTIYAVYRSDGGYGAVYSRRISGEHSEIAGLYLGIEDGRIVRLIYGCGQTPENFIERVDPESFVLPPS